MTYSQKYDYRKRLSRKKQLIKGKNIDDYNEEILANNCFHLILRGGGGGEERKKTKRNFLQ